MEHVLGSPGRTRHPQALLLLLRCSQRPMDAADVYKFDLQGLIRIRGVLSPEEVAAANAAIDLHREEFELEPGRSEPFQHIEGLLGWPAGERDPFVHMLAHKRLIPYLNTICGQGFRMDHGPTILTMGRDEREGSSEDMEVTVGLHGSSGPGFEPSQYYLWRDGKMHNSLVVISFALCDQRPGDGGFVVVPGSHKSNLRGPDELYTHTAHTAAAFTDSYYGFQVSINATNDDSHTKQGGLCTKNEGSYTKMMDFRRVCRRRWAVMQGMW